MVDSKAYLMYDKIQNEHNQQILRIKNDTANKITEFSPANNFTYNNKSQKQMKNSLSEANYKQKIVKNKYLIDKIMQEAKHKRPEDFFSASHSPLRTSMIIDTLKSNSQKKFFREKFENINKKTNNVHQEKPGKIIKNLQMLYLDPIPHPNKQLLPIFPELFPRNN